MSAAALSLQDLARALGGDVSNGQVLAPGPNHSAADRSLSVALADTDDGFIVNSFSNDDALAAKDYVREKLGRPVWQPRQATLETEYVYKQPDGTPHLRVVRRDRPGGGKDYPQFNWTGRAWKTGKPAGPKIPYRLDEMLAALKAVAHTTIFVVEGEKCADRLWSLGLIATTASEGAGKWTADLAPWFDGLTVHVLADNDEPGRRHAQQVAASLNGVAESVHVVEFHDLRPKGDVVDWLDAGGTKDGLIERCAVAPVWEPSAFRKSTPAALAAPTFVTAADLQTKTFAPVLWAVPGIIPQGLTIVASKPKLGKIWLMLATCLATASGGFVLDRHCVEGDALYAALEDGQRRLKDRLAKVCAASSWPARLTFCTEMPNLAEGGLEFLENWIASAKDPRLIVIDTFAKVRPTTARQETQYEADYRAAGMLKALADRSGVAVIIVHHVRKMEAEDPFDMVSGTNGLTGAADTILVLKRQADGVTLYARGRDIEEQELALEFQKDVCKWRVLGDAQEVRRSEERIAILDALRDEGQMTPLQISAVTGKSRGSVRVLLRKMAAAGEVTKAKKGEYALP